MSLKPPSEPTDSFVSMTSLSSRLGSVESDTGALTDAIIHLGVSLPPNADVDLTGATNATGAVQARIDALPGRGGTIMQPGGSVITCSGTLDFTGKPNVLWLGGGGAYGGADSGPDGQTKLEYTGSGRFIDARSTIGLVFEGVNIASFTSYTVLVDYDKTSNDTLSFAMRDCWLRGTNNGTGVLVSLTGAQSGVFSHCVFTGGARAIRGTTTGSGADFSNSMTINDRCIFQYQASAPILNPNQAWSITDCVFQQTQSASGPAGAVECQAGHLVEGFSYSGNSHQDTTGGGNWLTLRGSGIDIGPNFWNTGAKFVVFAGGCSATTVTTTSGSANLTAVSTTHGWRNGMVVTGAGIPAGTTILSGAGTATMVMSANATASASGIAVTGSCNGVNVHGNQFWGATTAALDGGTAGVTNFDDSGNDWFDNAADLIGNFNVDLGGVIPGGDLPAPATTAAAWPSANRSIFVRYVPKVTHTAAGLAFHCTTADAGTPNGDVAVLSSGRARLASSGAVSAVATTGIRSLAFTASVVLRKGVVYYVGMGLVSATAQVIFSLNMSTGTTAEIISNATPNLLQGLRDANVPIANPTSGLSSVASVPFMALKTA